MLKIRLRQVGRKNRRMYRIVVADAASRRDGKYCECVGFYHPFLKDQTRVDGERIRYWMGVGAQLTDSARAIVRSLCPEVLQS